MAALVLVRFLVALPVGAVLGGYLTRRLPAGVVTAVGMALRRGRLRAGWRTWQLETLETPRSNIPLVICGFGFGLALAPVNAAVLASTDDDVHGLATRPRRGRPDGRHAGRHLRADHDRAAPLLRRARRTCPVVREVCDGKSRCTEFTAAAQGGRHRPGAHGLPGAAVCAVVAGVLALVLFRSAATRASRRRHGCSAPAAERQLRSASVGADFDDLLAANAAYAADFDPGGFDGVAHAGVAIVTCMDSRIDPLRMVGLQPGDAKIFRNPGGRVTPAGPRGAGARRAPAQRRPRSWSSRTPAAR